MDCWKWCYSTIVRRKAGGYPSSTTDGDEISNTTGLSCVTTLAHNYFYSLYSWNNTLGVYSELEDFAFGGLEINAYNITNGENISSFDVFIKNDDGTVVYTQTDCTNPKYIDFGV